MIVGTPKPDRVCGLERVDEVLDAFFAERIDRAEALGAQQPLLWRRAAASARGGKRLRPRLVLLAHDLLDGGDRDSAAIAAAAFEVLHTALLLHDDVLDGDVVRRGAPNLPGGFIADARVRGIGDEGARAWGAASGLLAGDALLSGVHTLVSGVDSPARADLHRIIDDAMLRTAAGEHADVGFALGTIPADADGIRAMMELKTAVYSFSAPLCAGALIAGADAATVSALDDLGRRLGFLYQLRDDLLGVFGTAERTGKSDRGDLREGKRTLLIAFAAGHPRWRDVEPLFGRGELDEPDAGRIRRALVSSGAVAAVERVLDRGTIDLSRALDAAPLPQGLRAELHRIARFCTDRDA